MSRPSWRAAKPTSITDGIQRGSQGPAGTFSVIPAELGAAINTPDARQAPWPPGRMLAKSGSEATTKQLPSVGLLDSRHQSGVPANLAKGGRDLDPPSVRRKWGTRCEKPGSAQCGGDHAQPGSSIPADRRRAASLGTGAQFPRLGRKPRRFALHRVRSCRSIRAASPGTLVPCNETQDEAGDGGRPTRSPEQRLNISCPHEAGTVRRHVQGTRSFPSAQGPDSGPNIPGSGAAPHATEARPIHCRDEVGPQSDWSLTGGGIVEPAGARPTDDHSTSPLWARNGRAAPLISTLTVAVHRMEIHSEDSSQRGRAESEIDESIRIWPRRWWVRDIGLWCSDAGTRGTGRADRARARGLSRERGG